MVQSVPIECAGSGLIVEVERDIRAEGGNAFLAIIICASAGVVAGLSLAWPFSGVLPAGKPVWLGSLLSIALLYVSVQAASTIKQALAQGAIFSTVWLASSIWWLFVAMYQYGGLNAPTALSAVGLLSFVLGLYYTCALGLFWTWKSSLGIWSPFVFSALWTGAELARGTWLSGFGWGAVGYAQVDGPLSMLAPWIGAYGIGAVVAMLSAALFEKSWNRYLRVALLPAVFFLPIAVPSAVTTWTQPTGKLQLALLQGNIPQDEKFEQGTGIPLALHWYREQLLASQTQLTIAPETAIPLLPAQLPPGYWGAIDKKFSDTKHALMLGIPLGDMSLGYTNSVLGLQGDAPTWRYNKHHLVPFGEFIPPMFRWFTQLMHIPLGDFESGALNQGTFDVFGQKLGTTICYEDLFGEELAVRFRDDATAPNILVNVSNIGWFGDTVAIDQHLHISRLRTLEFERPFVRSTNTGATAIIDHRGIVVSELARHTRGVLLGVTEGRSGVTPYAWWVSRFGLWPLWMFVLLVSVWAWRRNKLAVAQA